MGIVDAITYKQYLYPLFSFSNPKGEKIKMIKRVVIWGDDHHNALGLLRMIGGRGFDVLLIISKKLDIATVSRFCTRYIVIPKLEDGLQYLIENYKDSENKAVLFFTADRYSEIANNSLSKLRDYFFVCGPIEVGVLQQIDDKFVMGGLASECGFNVPKTYLLPRDKDYPINIYPLIIKPCRPVSKDFKTIIVKDEREYAAALKKLIPEKRYVVQQYIKKIADCLVYGYRTIDGKTIIAGACVRNRWSDDGCGSFGYVTPDLPEGVDAVPISDFLSRINFYGVFSVEYGLTEGNAYFYEFNLRNDGTSHLFYQAGANIALAFVNSCFGEEITESVQIKSKQYLINEFWDRYNVNDKVITKKQYKQDFERSTIFFYYDPDDMEPYNVQKAQNTWRSIRRMISKSMINKVRLEIKKQEAKEKQVI